MSFSTTNRDHVDLSPVARTPADDTPTVQQGAGVCLNCSAVLTGPFCATCGQRDVPPYPSVRDLVVDAFWELSGWDGRFSKTVRALVQQPGLLTREFLEGRRARYISPLRLYLMASLVYFVLAAAAPETKGAGGATVQVSGPDRVGRVGRAVSSSLSSKEAPNSAERDSVLGFIPKAPALMRPLLRRTLTDPAGFKRGIFEAMPRMLFALLPVFAGIVALFYRRRKYPEHLYFAIHFHAFVFLAMSISALARFTELRALIAVIGTLVLLWIPTYATLAFRRVYGGSIMRTLAKEAGISALYVTVSLLALLVMIYWVSIMA